MGIPLFFKWILTRYPKCITYVKNKDDNNLEIDNLYLDMNGLIHPSAKPEGQV